MIPKLESYLCLLKELKWWYSANVVKGNFDLDEIAVLTNKMKIPGGDDLRKQLKQKIRWKQFMEYIKFVSVKLQLRTVLQNTLLKYRK
jgi:hypothetical protein